MKNSLSKKVTSHPMYLSCILMLLVLSGCVSVKGIVIPDESSTQLPNEVKLDVVHIIQNDRYSCATTAATMSLSYFEGLKLDQDESWDLSKTSKTTALEIGNDMGGLKNIAKHYGYKGEYAQGLTYHDLRYLTSQGIPVILNILQRPGGNATHAILVIGYNNDEQVFYINDPIGGKTMSYERLKARWKAHLSSPQGMSTRSGFIIYPKKTT